MFCIDFSDRRARVRRARNERFAPVCAAEHDRYGKGLVMVWAGISMQGKTDLQIIENGTLTTVRYVNEILEFYVRPYAGTIGADSFLWTIMRAHTEHTSLTNIWKMLPSLAHSLYMNLIDHAWDMLQKAISARSVQPTTVPQLRTVLQEEWGRFPHRQLGWLINSMWRRCKIVIDARGHHTRY